MKCKIGDIIEGVVTGIEDYGIFIKFADGFSGLIHISEISDSFVKNINDYTKIGDKIKAKVIEIDNQNKQLKLSIKSIRNSKLEESPNGFTALKNELPIWIDEKIKEYDI